MCGVVSPFEQHVAVMPTRQLPRAPSSRRFPIALPRSGPISCYGPKRLRPCADPTRVRPVRPGRRLMKWHHFLLAVALALGLVLPASAGLFFKRDKEKPTPAQRVPELLETLKND